MCADNDAESGGAIGPAALALTTNIARLPLAEISPLDVGSVVSDLRSPEPGEEPVGGPEEDDEDACWRDVDDFTAFSDIL